MRPITIFRAFAWLGVAVIFWSLNLRWGIDEGLPGGPPTSLWERLVVAAGLLAMVSAITLSVSGRKDNPPSWNARGIAGVAAFFVVVIGLYLRSNAAGILVNAIEGQGWTWMMAGGGLVAGAVVGSFGLKKPIRRPPKGSRKRRK